MAAVPAQINNEDKKKKKGWGQKIKEKVKSLRDRISEKWGEWAESGTPSPMPG